MNTKLFLFLLKGLLLISLETRAVITFGLANSARNTPELSFQGPWSATAEIVSGNGQVAGGGVHIGNNYFLTADHVEIGPEIRLGNHAFSIDPSFQPQQIGQADIKVFRALGSLNVPAIQLYGERDELSQEFLMVATGIGRDETRSNSEDLIQIWDFNSQAKRWARSTPSRGLDAFDDRGFGFRKSYITDGLTFQARNEALTPAFTQGDSGSGAFIRKEGVWFLAGIVSRGLDAGELISTLGNPESRFGNPTLGSAYDSALYVRVSSYKSEVELILIPEPSETSVFFALLAFGAGLYRKTRSR